MHQKPVADQKNGPPVVCPGQRSASLSRGFPLLSEFFLALPWHDTKMYADQADQAICHYFKRLINVKYMYLLNWLDHRIVVRRASEDTQFVGVTWYHSYLQCYLSFEVLHHARCVTARYGSLLRRRWIHQLQTSRPR